MKFIVSLLLLFTMSMSNAQISESMKLQANMNPNDGLCNDIWGYEHNGEEFAILGCRTTVNVYNVTDCANPTLAHQWTGLNPTTWRDFKDYGDYIYIVDDNGNNGLLILDKNNFTQYTQNIPSSDDFTRSHNIFIDKQHGRLYAVGGNVGNRNTLGIYDLSSNPTNPPLLKKIDLQAHVSGTGTYYIHDMYVKDHIGYASHEGAGLRVWDFSDVNNILLLGAYNNGTTNYCHSNWLTDDGNYLYLAYEVPTGVPVEVLDVSDLTNIHVVNTFKEPLLAPTHTDATPHNPFVVDDLLYISYYEDGTAVFDISDPINPERVAYYDTYPGNTSYSGYNGCWGTYPFLPSGCILASDRSTGLYTLRTAIEPASTIKVVDRNLLIDLDNTNFVLRDLYENEYQFVVDPITLKVDTASVALSTPKASVVNANLYFETVGTSPIIKQNNVYYKLVIRNGNITAVVVNTLPTDLVNFNDGSIALTHYSSGLILKDDFGNCFKVHLDDNGVLNTESVACP